MEDEGSVFYLAPYLECRNPRCGEDIALPYGLLPQLIFEPEDSELEDEDQPLTPPDGWSESFGCIACGRVATYDSPHVTIRDVPHKTQGQFHDDATLYAIRFRDAAGNYATPDRLLVDTRGASEGELHKKLDQQFFFGDMKSGRGIAVRPGAYAIERITSRLW